MTEQLLVFVSLLIDKKLQVILGTFKTKLIVIAGEKITFPFPFTRKKQ